jgi:hypothetical protein
VVAVVFLPLFAYFLAKLGMSGYLIGLTTLWMAGGIFPVLFAVAAYVVMREKPK